MSKLLDVPLFSVIEAGFRNQLPLGMAPLLHQQLQSLRRNGLSSVVTNCATDCLKLGNISSSLLMALELLGVLALFSPNRTR